MKRTSALRVLHRDSRRPPLPATGSDLPCRQIRADIGPKPSARDGSFASEPMSIAVVSFDYLSRRCPTPVVKQSYYYSWARRRTVSGASLPAQLLSPLCGLSSLRMRQVRFEPSLTYYLLISLNLMLFLHVSADPLDRVFQMSASQIAKLHLSPKQDSFRRAVRTASSLKIAILTRISCLCGHSSTPPYTFGGLY